MVTLGPIAGMSRKIPPDWLRSHNPKLYCVLLGSFGMGKEKFEDFDSHTFCRSIDTSEINITAIDEEYQLGQFTSEGPEPESLNFNKFAYTFKDFSTISWIHLAFSVLLSLGFIANIMLFRGERGAKRKNRGARLLYLTSIALDALYCLQAFFYSIVYFVRSAFHSDAEDIEQCVFVTLNIFVLRLVFLSNLIMVITRFIAIFCPFWFINHVTFEKARIVLLVFLLFACVETGIIIRLCLQDSIEMLANIYWGATTLFFIVFIVLCNIGLLLLAHYIFIRQRNRLYRRNGTYEMFRNLTKTKAAITKMGVIAMGTVGVDSNRVVKMISPQKKFVGDNCFREHADKQKVKRLLLITALSYLVLVLPHFAVQVLAHTKIDAENWNSWKCAFFSSLLLVNFRFFINPFMYALNKWQHKRAERNKRRSSNPPALSPRTLALTERNEAMTPPAPAGVASTSAIIVAADNYGPSRIRESKL